MGRRVLALWKLLRFAGHGLPGSPKEARVWSAWYVFSRFQERALAALNEVAVDGEVIAIVSHDAILQLALAAMLDLPLDSYRGLCQSTATLNQVTRSDGVWSVTLLNSSWHLRT